MGKKTLWHMRKANRHASLHMRSLARTYAVRSYKRWVKGKTPAKELDLQPCYVSCALKICFNGKSKERFSRDMAYLVKSNRSSHV